jgi:HPt (histidine-containing phosphotransfer) domain-containing protein
MFPHYAQASNSVDSCPNATGVQANPRVTDGSSSMLRQLQLSLGSSIVQDIVRRVRDDTAARLSAIRESLAVADFAAIKREAHLIKGSAAVVGAEWMSSLCRRIEDTADAGDGPAVSPLLDDLKVEVDRIYLTMGPVADTTT